MSSLTTSMMVMPASCGSSSRLDQPQCMPARFARLVEMPPRGFGEGGEHTRLVAGKVFARGPPEESNAEGRRNLQAAGAVAG